MEEIICSLFSPQVHLCSTDPWLPVSVEWFISHCELYFQIRTRTTKQRIMIDSTPNPNNLHENTYKLNNNVQYSSYGNTSKDRSKNYYLKIKSPEYYFGMSLDELRNNEIPVYVHFAKKEEYIDIQYFYLYAYNGNIMDNLRAGVHEGDWEHTSVRLSLDIFNLLPNYLPDDQWVATHINELKSCILCIFYARHGKEGKWYFQEASNSILDDGYYLVENTLHHIVYSAKGGHASYTTPNPRNRRYVPFGIPIRIIDDYTDDSGEIWKTWNNIVILNKDDENQKWLHFNGEWGGKAENILSANGPYGPLMKTYYYTGDVEPTDVNSVYRDSIPHPCAPHFDLWKNVLLRSLFAIIILLVFAALIYFFSLIIWNQHRTL